MNRPYRMGEVRRGETRLASEGYPPCAAASAQADALLEPRFESVAKMAGAIRESPLQTSPTPQLPSLSACEVRRGDS